jgi:hypothetical protein
MLAACARRNARHNEWLRFGAGKRPVGCANWVSRGEAVFVDESAEAVSALDAGGWRAHDTELPGGRIGRREVSEPCGLWLL